MKSFILIAPPAAGKGSLANILSKEYNIPHISTGDLLRERSNVDDEAGIDLLCQLQTGELIDDSIVLTLLKSRLMKPDCKNGYILDGYPRNMSQAYGFNNVLVELGLSLNYVIYLDINIEDAYKRVTGRMSCPNCGAVYNKNVSSKLPKIDGICNECSSKLIVRSDDNKESLIERFETFNQHTLPVVEYYSKTSKFLKFDGRIDSEEILRQLDILIKGEI